MEKQGKKEETWPNLSNCIRDCKECDGRCFYRKEPKERNDSDRRYEVGASAGKHNMWKPTDEQMDNLYGLLNDGSCDLDIIETLHQDLLSLRASDGQHKKKITI